MNSPFHLCHHHHYLHHLRHHKHHRHIIVVIIIVIIIVITDKRAFQTIILFYSLMLSPISNSCSFQVVLRMSNPSPLLSNIRSKITLGGLILKEESRLRVRLGLFATLAWSAITTLLFRTPILTYLNRYNYFIFHAHSPPIRHPYLNRYNYCVIPCTYPFTYFPPLPELP